MAQAPRPYGRAYLFGRAKQEDQKRDLSDLVLGNIEPEWDDLVNAEIDAVNDQDREPAN